MGKAQGLAKGAVAIWPRRPVRPFTVLGGVLGVAGCFAARACGPGQQPFELASTPTAWAGIGRPLTVTMTSSAARLNCTELYNYQLYYTLILRCGRSESRPILGPEGGQGDQRRGEHNGQRQAPGPGAGGADQARYRFAEDDQREEAEPVGEMGCVQWHAPSRCQHGECAGRVGEQARGPEGIPGPDRHEVMPGIRRFLPTGEPAADTARRLYSVTEISETIENVSTRNRERVRT